MSTGERDQQTGVPWCRPGSPCLAPLLCCLSLCVAPQGHLSSDLGPAWVTQDQLLLSIPFTSLPIFALQGNSHPFVKSSHSHTFYGLGSVISLGATFEPTTQPSSVGIGRELGGASANPLPAYKLETRAQNKSFIQEVGAWVHELQGGDKRPSQSIPREEKVAQNTNNNRSGSRDNPSDIY